MSILQEPYGIMPDGRSVSKFKLTNNSGMVVEIINYGGIVTTILAPDRNGKLTDVALGFDTLSGYLGGNPSCFGALIGRFANRIENARFVLNGRICQLNKNEGENHLHGGFAGYDKVLWDAEVQDSPAGSELILRYLSKDGEEHYPGNLQVKVTYRLNDDSALSIHYEAVCDQDTVINLTNHSYFNLAGQSTGSIADHILTIKASRFTPVRKDGIPTGVIRAVQGTPMDFTRGSRIGDGFASEYEQIKAVSGYDHNFVLDDSATALKKIAELYEPASGRFMETFTTKPAVQFYSGNFLTGQLAGKGGYAYPQRSGLCLETQYFPNGMNCVSFPKPVLKAGERYDHTTVYRFSAR
jgi:aldose 1-epimerase